MNIIYRILRNFCLLMCGKIIFRDLAWDRSWFYWFYLIFCIMFALIFDVLVEHNVAEKTNGWISINKQLPDTYRVRFKDRHGNTFVGNYSRTANCFYAYGIMPEITDVTHWMKQI